MMSAAAGNSVFGQVLFAQWKSSRGVLVPMLVIAFGLPISAVLSARRVAARYAAAGGSQDAAALLNAFEVWAAAFPLLALAAGAVAALSAWNWDHRTNHVYALSLPISRPRYSLNKLAAGAIPIAALAVLVLLGGLAVTAAVSLPAGVTAYPFALAFRFFLCALVMYALVFSLASGSVRTLVTSLLILAVVMVLGGLVTESIESLLGLRDLRTPGEMIHRALLEWPGPFSVLGGNWMLLDV